MFAVGRDRHPPLNPVQVDAGFVEPALRDRPLPGPRQPTRRDWQRRPVELTEHGGSRGGGDHHSLRPEPTEAAGVSRSGSGSTRRGACSGVS